MASEERCFSSISGPAFVLVQVMSVKLDTFSFTLPPMGVRVLSAMRCCCFVIIIIIIIMPLCILFTAEDEA